MTEANEGAGAIRPPASPCTPPPVTVVCVGNTLMADDGVGAAVGRALTASGLPDRCVVDVRPYADMSLVGILRDSCAVVVVDAIDVGAEAGAVFRFTPDEAGLTQMRSHNTHGMGVGYAVTSARMLGVERPVVVFGVQIGDVRPLPDTLSPDVAAVVPEVASLVAEEVRRLAAEAEATESAGADAERERDAG